MILTREKFRNYLTSQPWRNSAGRCGVPIACALAQFLVSQPGVESARVGHGTYSLLSEKELIRTKTPKWARNFIDAYDEGDVRHKSFGTAIRLLDEVKYA